jgi:hypothetical protein
VNQHHSRGKAGGESEKAFLNVENVHQELPSQLETAAMEYPMQQEKWRRRR